ncbi:hypothetical protein [Nocardiopsis lambiniae]|uniref:DUF4262 domain-containing protein n=1 Tax=Nocardiopsis lambiniae TaxID=3075539 RepID=A0ABU2M755_9ACTN|nr:hypothetical protein [Nocardiopsis sp. DSM 44743]MDT0328486.1 hypothetical protein [Nocardiopsis sp. DSM 44743]
MDATTAEFAQAARRAGFFAVVEGPGQVDIRGVTQDGEPVGAMRFRLVTQARREVWRYEFPAREIPAPGSGLFNNFPRYPGPEDFGRLGYWWRDFATGPEWQYHPQDWMRPQAWTCRVGVRA